MNAGAKAKPSNRLLAIVVHARHLGRPTLLTASTLWGFSANTGFEAELALAARPRECGAQLAGGPCELKRAESFRGVWSAEPRTLLTTVPTSVAFLHYLIDIPRCLIIQLVAGNSRVTARKDVGAFDCARGTRGHLSSITASATPGTSRNGKQNEMIWFFQGKAGPEAGGGRRGIRGGRKKSLIPHST
jgi:hypothetical protein